MGLMGGIGSMGALGELRELGALGWMGRMIGMAIGFFIFHFSFSYGIVAAAV